MDLFEYNAQIATRQLRPLAEKMRPQTLDAFVGQSHIVGPGTILRNAITKDKIFSMILWGPPGCGKTTLAKIIANETQTHFIQISAVLSGIKEIRSVIEEAQQKRRLNHKRTILFVDEIHRFNKSQQDAFLNHVENGLITLIGATTENPSFEVIPALISRCKVIQLYPLAPEDMQVILLRALSDETSGLGRTPLKFSDEALNGLAQAADGDVRVALNFLELIAFQMTASEIENQPPPMDSPQVEVSITDIQRILQKKALRYDKSGDGHYDMISAFHKSLRGSDPDAAIYWLARMLKSGENPFYILRRMVRFASEDIGVADPHALRMALDALDAFRFLGHPEGEEAIVQATVYLATAPKSNRIYTAYKTVKTRIDETGSLSVPLHIRNAPTQLMASLGHGKGYQYPHDSKEGIVSQSYLPESLLGQEFYFPTDRGYEKVIKQRLDGWKRFKNQHRQRT